MGRKNILLAQITKCRKAWTVHFMSTIKAKSYTREKNRFWGFALIWLFPPFLQWFLYHFSLLCLITVASLTSLFSSSLSFSYAHAHTHMDTHVDRSVRWQHARPGAVPITSPGTCLRAFSQFCGEPASLSALPLPGYSPPSWAEAPSCLLVKRQGWFWAHSKARQVPRHDFVLVTWELAWGDALTWHKKRHRRWRAHHCMRTRTRGKCVGLGPGARSGDSSRSKVGTAQMGTCLCTITADI